jgi:hypothetical protein
MFLSRISNPRLTEWEAENVAFKELQFGTARTVGARRPEELLIICRK